MKAIAALAIIVLLVPLTGCSRAAAAGAGAQPAAGALSNEEFDAIYKARADSMRSRFTQADVRFMNGMIHHHAQAIEVSQLAPSRASSPSIQTLAARIINAQRDEIALMQQWLRDRGQTVPEVHITDSAVMLHGAGHDMHMPGMLSAEQVAQLRGTTGAAFDRRFLELMIQHHRGAVKMVHELFATYGAGQDEAVFKFASDVQVDQSTEVARMERMLAAMPAGGRAP
jgi:uncharacterized protein (DUF305 family)